MICPVKWVLVSLDSTTQMWIFFFFFGTVRESDFVAGKYFAPSRKHWQSTVNCRLMKSSHSCLIGTRRRFKTPGNKPIFSRIIEHKGQTLLIDCNFVKVSTPMSIYNLSHLKCTMVNEEVQKLKNRVCQGSRKSKSILSFLYLCWFIKLLTIICTQTPFFLWCRSRL